MIPRIGDFFLSRPSNPVHRAVLTHACRTPWTHGGINLGEGRILHTASSYRRGARIDHITQIRDPRWSSIVMTHTQRGAIVCAARAMVGVPFPTGHVWRIAAAVRPDHDVTAPIHEQPWWVRRLLAQSDTAYCLQIITRAYRAAGIDLLGDGRPQDLVRPQDLLPFVGDPL